MSHSVLLVDDHDVVRQGLALLLGSKAKLTIVGEAGNGITGIELARLHQPDLIMLDLMMPDMDGLTAISGILTASPASKVVILTSSEDNETAFSAVEAGAHGFLLKSMCGPELLDAIERILDDEVVVHPTIAQSILRSMKALRSPDKSPFDALSERELAILRVLADGASNARLADIFCISVTTVKSHVSNILSKLQLLDRTEAVAFAWRNGLMEKESATSITKK